MTLNGSLPRTNVPLARNESPWHRPCIRHRARRRPIHTRQVRRVTEHAADRDLDLLEVYEITESSTKDTRKKFEAVIKRIKESKEPIALIVDTIDRLQRSFRESVELGDLLKQGKLELHFLRENLVLNQRLQQRRPTALGHGRDVRPKLCVAVE